MLNNMFEGKGMAEEEHDNKKTYKKNIDEEDGPECTGKGAAAARIPHSSSSGAPEPESEIGDELANVSAIREVEAAENNSSLVTGNTENQSTTANEKPVSPTPNLDKVAQLVAEHDSQHSGEVEVKLGSANMKPRASLDSLTEMVDSLKETVGSPT